MRLGSMLPSLTSSGHQNAVKRSTLFVYSSVWVPLIFLLSIFLTEEATHSFQSSNTETPVHYSRDVKPILSAHCFACHGPDSQNQDSDLRLDAAKNWKEDLDDQGYGTISPGFPNKSELIARVTSIEDGHQMPPMEFGKPLSKKQKEILAKWIKEGAKWEQHWSYRPLEVKIDKQTSLSKIIDDRIQSKLQEKGWNRNPQAKPAILIRRLYLDLTGLPPTVEQANEYLKDPTEGTYRRIVDRILKSPAHAEHLTSYWLDWVRFADTVGYHGDQPHAAWPYRDFVINSFLTNRPYDEFSKMQIAGDLKTDNEIPGALSENLIASCYNRLLQTTHEGGAQDKEYRAKYLADRVRNFSEVWLGATMGCAECHDHKFDPLTQEDFYSLGAFFADIHEKGSYDKISPNATPTTRPPQSLVLSPLSFSSLSKAELQQIIQALTEKQPTNKVATHDQSFAQWRTQVKLQKELDKSLQTTIKQLNTLRKKSSLPVIDLGQCMITRSVKPLTVRVLERGDWMDESGAVMIPKPPAHFGNWNKSGKTRGTRKDLADWLFTKRNPLVARVHVNRLWGIFFGDGLSRNQGDFGAQGTWPTHPELLDELVFSFQSNGWNNRKIIRSIVLSQTYKQSSDRVELKTKTDPENRLYWRQNPRRVRAETVRDVALFTCGILDKKVGGASVKPYQPVGYYANLNFPKRTYRHDKGPAQYRRGLYIHWQRQFLHPMLKAFDAPSREECTAQRTVSNTPSAALVLLNDPTFFEAARHHAFQLLSKKSPESKITNQRLKESFEKILTRPPTEKELQFLESTLKKELSFYQKNPKLAEEFLKTGTALPLKTLKKFEIKPENLAAWTQVTRILLNLDETITVY